MAQENAIKAALNLVESNLENKRNIVSIFSTHSPLLISKSNKFIDTIIGPLIRFRSQQSVRKVSVSFLTHMKNILSSELSIFKKERAKVLRANDMKAVEPEHRVKFEGLLIPKELVAEIKWAKSHSPAYVQSLISFAMGKLG